MITQHVMTCNIGVSQDKKKTAYKEVNPRNQKKVWGEERNGPEKPGYRNVAEQACSAKVFFANELLKRVLARRLITMVWERKRTN